MKDGIIRVLLAEDHAMMRAGLRSMLEQMPGIKVVGEAGDGSAAVELACRLNPDIVLMDITLPGLNGVEATGRIHAECPGCRVVGLSMHSERQFVMAMLQAGASGYLLKNSAVGELSAAIDAVTRGQTYLSPGIIANVLQLPQPGNTNAFDHLTAREREVLQLLSEGLSNKQIALSLRLSIKTIESHRAQVMEKLDIHNVAGLTKYAIRSGLTSIEP